MSMPTAGCMGRQQAAHALYAAQQDPGHQVQPGTHSYAHAQTRAPRAQGPTLLVGVACAGMLSLLGVAARAPGVAAAPGLGLAASLGVMRRGAMPFLAPGVVGGPPVPASCWWWKKMNGFAVLGWAVLDMLRRRLSVVVELQLCEECGRWLG